MNCAYNRNRPHSTLTKRFHMEVLADQEEKTGFNILKNITMEDMSIRRLQHLIVLGNSTCKNGVITYCEDYVAAEILDDFLRTQGDLIDAYLAVFDDIDIDMGVLTRMGKSVAKLREEIFPELPEDSGDPNDLNQQLSIAENALAQE